MIREIFLPEKLFGKQIIPQKILGISIGDTSIKTVSVHAKERKTEVVELNKFNISLSNDKDAIEERINTLKKITPQVTNYDKIAIAIPASLIVFKELRIPLKNEDKIRLVIENELEPMLPFSIENAIVDFIITRQAKDENDTQILAAAIQKDDLQSILDLYSKADIFPTNITIDLFATYNLYNQITDYNSIKNGSVLIEIREYSTQIAFLENNELRLVRTLPKGLFTVAQEISKETNKTQKEVLNELVENGILESKENTVTQKHIINLLNNIQFTLNSFALKIGYYHDIKKILFSWQDIEIPNFEQFAHNVLQTPCERFDVKKILSIPQIINKALDSNQNWNEYTQALGTAIPSIFPTEFNLRRKTFKIYPKSLVKKQIATALTLIIIAIGSLTTFGYFQIHKFSSKVSTIKQQEIQKLKQVLSRAAKDTDDTQTEKRIKRTLRISQLTPLIKQTKTIVETEEKAWGNLEKLKLPTLQILHKLTKIISVTDFNINIKDISLRIDVDNAPTAEVVGILKSKQDGEDFQEYAKFEQQISDKCPNYNLTLIESDSFPAEESDGGGAKFTLVFKQEEK